MTDLSPSEVPWHGSEFGRFALEFDVAELRNIGAFPVMYFPNGPGNEGGSWLGKTIISRLGVVGNVLLPRLQEVLTAANTAPNDQTVLAKLTNGFELPAGLIKGLVSHLLASNYAPADLAEAVRASANFWGPTDNVRHNTLMGYYQQREWRLSPAASRPGLTYAPPTPAHTQALLAVDPAFFSRVLQLPQPHAATPMPQACAVLQSVDGQHILRFVRRFVVPQAAIADVLAIVQSLVPNPQVVAIESLW